MYIFKILPAVFFFTLLITTAGRAQTKKVKESFKVLDEGSIIITEYYIEDETCIFGNDGEVNINVEGGFPPYTYEWRDELNTLISTDANLDNVPAGTYVVTVTDNTGCSSSASFTVGYSCPYSCPGFITLFVIDPSLCYTANGEINATLLEPGPYDYRLYRVDQYNSSYTLIESGTQPGVTFNRTFTNLSAGRYELIVTTPDLCDYSASADLISPDFNFLSFGSNNNTSCISPNGSINLSLFEPNPPPNYLVRWKDIYRGTEDSRPENNTDIVINNLWSSYYVVEVQNLNLGCTVQQGIFVGSSAPFLSVVINNITPQTTCVPPNGSISIDVLGGSGSYSYSWSTPSGFLFTKDINNLTSGTHSLFVSDAISGCTNNPTSSNYNVPNSTVPPSANFVVTASTACTQNNGAINLTPIGTGPFTVMWYNETLDVIGTEEDIEGLAPGKYGFRLTNQADGCVLFVSPQDTGAPEVGDLSVPSITISGQVFNSTDCNANPGNGAIDLTVTTSAQSITYLWSGPSGFTSANQDISNLQPGTYTVVVEVECISNTPPVITPPPLSVSQGQTLLDLDLLNIISDAENNFVIDSLKIIRQPVSGANAQLLLGQTSAILRIDYSGISFIGIDSLRIEACDALGACSQREIFINVEITATVIVYNAVSPVGAPGNRYLRIEGLPPAPVSTRVTVYNRWGDEVFRTEGYDNDTNRFEGRSSNGNELPGGTYFYKIEIGNASPITGFLSLKR